MTRMQPAAILVVLIGTLSSYAGDQEAGSSKQPAESLFTRHVVPLFSRLGCKIGRAHV